MSLDRREFLRIEVRLPADLLIPDGQRIEAFTQDVSYRGTFLETERRLPLGTPVDLTLWLGGRGHGLGLRTKAVVARQTEGGLGLRIDEITLDTFEHLRSLILFNAQDPDRASREIQRDLGYEERA